MKKFSLAGLSQKITCLIILLLFIIINIILYFLSIPRTIKIIFLLVSLLISIVYFYIIFSSRILINQAEKIIEVKMFNKTVINLNNIDKIIVKKNQIQNKEILVLTFINFQGQETDKIHTFFTSKQSKYTKEIVDFLRDLIE